MLLEKLLDALGKEAKEAPGWFLLILACNRLPFALLFPNLDGLLQRVGVEGSGEHSAIATLVGITFFFAGDLVDTFLFPRRTDESRIEKALHSVLLALAAWAAFFTVQRRPVAIVLWAIWLAPFLLYRLIRKRASGRKEKDTGWRVLIWPKRLRNLLETTTTEALGRLGLHSGVYGVAKALAKNSRAYAPWILALNESAKFVRSAIAPLVAWTFYLALFRPSAWAAATGAGVVLALALSFSLKARHLLLLYRRVPHDLPAADLAPGLRVFWTPAGKWIGCGTPAATPGHPC